MKKEFKKKAVWISYDGKEFDTKKQCEKYEKDHPAPVPSLIDRRIEDLEEVEHGISCHKSLNWEFYEDRLEFTWYCGRKHQEALKKLAATKKSKDLSKLDKLVAIGDVAREVRNWKTAEKKAYEQLMKLRQRREMLRAEIADLRKDSEITEHSDGSH